MGYKIIDRQYSKCVDDYRLTIIADKDEDILDLPLACVGSTVIVADRGNEYMANTEGGWVFKSGDESRAVKYVVGAKEIAGTWVLNDDAMYVPTDGWFSFPFVLGSTNGFGFGYSDFYETLVWEYDFDGDGNGDGEEQMYTQGTNSTLITSATVDSVENGEALLAWLNANATKIAEPEGGNDEGGNDEGGSSDVLAGTWSFNGELLFDKRYAFDIEFKGVGHDALYTEIVGEYNGEAHTLTYNGPNDVCYAYIDLGGGWSGPYQIEILIPYESAMRADELLAFLNKYATKIA